MPWTHPWVNWPPPQCLKTDQRRGGASLKPRQPTKSNNHYRGLPSPGHTSSAINEEVQMHGPTSFGVVRRSSTISISLFFLPLIVADTTRQATRRVYPSRWINLLTTTLSRLKRKTERIICPPPQPPSVVRRQDGGALLPTTTLRRHPPLLETRDGGALLSTSLFQRRRRGKPLAPLFTTFRRMEVV